MVTITAADASPSSRAWPRWWRRGQARDAAASAARTVATAASTIRARDWSPALTIGGLAAIDIAAWETFGRGAAWLALGASTLLFDWQRDR